MTACWTDLELAGLALGSEPHVETGPDETDAPVPDAARRAHGDACPACAAALARMQTALLALAKLPEAEAAPAPPPAVWEQVRSRVETTAAAARLAPEIRIACTYCKGRLEGRARHCAVCLGPHHDDCWEDHGRCASCGATLFVRAESSESLRRPRETWRAAGLVLAGALAGVGAAAAFALKPWREPVPTGWPVPTPTPTPSPSPSLPSLPLPGGPLPRSPRPRTPEPVARISPAGPFRFGRDQKARFGTHIEAPLAFDEASGFLVAASREGEAVALARDAAHDAFQPAWRIPLGDFGDPTPGFALGPGQGKAGPVLVVPVVGGHLRVLDLLSGRARWQADVGSPIVLRPAVARPERGPVAIFATADGDVCGLDLETGRLLWRTALEPAVAPPLVVVAGTRTLVFVATRADALHVLDAATGERAFDSYPGAPITAGPVARGGRVFVGTDDGRVIASDPPGALGVSFVSTPLGSRVEELAPLGEDTVAARTASGVSVLDGRGSVRAFRAFDPGEITGLVVGRRLYVVERNGPVSALDLGTLDVVWTGTLFPEGKGSPWFRVTAPPVLLRDRLCVVGDTDGGLYSLSIEEP